MRIFDKLKHIIKIDWRGFKFLSPNITIIQNTQNKDKIIVSKDENKILLNYPSLDEEEKQLLIDSIKEGFENKESDLLEEKSEARVRDIKQKSELQSIKSVIEFYKDKISDEHWRALEASLYVREVFRQEQPVRELKRNIIRKFGEDGRNISNLCTAGYFEGYIKQVYEEMKFNPDFVIEKFQDYFKKIVSTSPFAIFVYRDMSEEELSGEIIHKLETYQKYGIKFLAIHGIGKDNVKKIRKIVQEIEEERNLTIEMAQEGNIIVIKIIF